MSRIFKKILRPVGLAPGSLLYTGSSPSDQVRLSIIEYTEDKFVEKIDVSVEECLEHLVTPTMTWIQVYGHHSDTIASIGNHFKFHSLVLEDILTANQRPKLDVYPDQVFIIARLLQYNTTLQDLKDEQVSIVFGPNYLVSFFEGQQDIFLPIKDRLRQSHHRIRKERSDYLAYALLDTLVDYYFVALEKTDAKLDHLEEEVTRYPQANTIQKIQQAKHDMIVLRKVVWPMRDVVNQFLRLEISFVNSTTQIYLHDVYDHAIQMIDIIEGFRDIIAGMLDIYLSNINIRTNEIMKVLTIVSTIFVPLTFITSLYGMNFEFMPELHKRWGYPIVIAVMILTAGMMLYYFRRKKWL
jgi:magnesium transporter